MEEKTLLIAILILLRVYDISDLVLFHSLKVFNNLE